MARYDGKGSWYDLFTNIFGLKNFKSLITDFISQARIYDGVLNLPISILLSKTYTSSSTNGHYFNARITATTSASAFWINSTDFRINGTVSKGEGYPVRCVAKSFFSMQATMLRRIGDSFWEHCAGCCRHFQGA